MRRSILQFLFSLTLSLICSAPVLADGGRVCWSGEVSRYRITVFSEPVPLRPGRVDLSLFLQDAERLAPINNTRAVFVVTPPDSSTPIEAMASRENATNPLFQAAHFQLPSPGTWQVELRVAGPHGEVVQRFPLEILPPRAAFWDVALWIFLPILPITIFVFRELHRPRTSIPGSDVQHSGLLT
ncbi:MAG: hypothetical protein N2C12_13340 [Planctomycetales bacterium]